MVYGMAWLAWHGMKYGQAGYMVRPSRHDIWYGLVRKAWYIVWPSGHRMVYGMA